MALVLEANYSKKLGLPGYSSHQYSVTVRTELADLSHVEAESSRLYRLLQNNVDRELQQTGFLPTLPHPNSSPNGHSNGSSTAETWKCTPKQKELILQIVEENDLPKDEVEELAQKLFRARVKTLNKLQASGFITELTAQYSKSRPPSQRRNGHVHPGGRS